MTRYDVADRRRNTPPPVRPHPVWRGIGCVFFIVVPLLAYAFAVITVNVGVAHSWPIPYQLLGNPTVPNSVWTAAPGLAPLWTFIQQQNNLVAKLVITAVYIVVLATLISMGYALLYRFVGPPRYGPLDAPPPKIKTKRYKR